MSRKLGSWMKLGVVGRCVLGWSGVAGAESAGSQPAAVVAKTFPIGDTVPGPNFEMELLNSATVGADSYLVAWDTTLQKSGLPRKHSATVTRIAKDGTLLDPRGIPFPRSKLVPDDAWYYWMLTGFDGANYRVGMQRENDTIFARLAPDGHFLDATDEQLLVVPGAKGLACTTDGACVTIHDEVVENGNRVSFIRLTKDNALVDPAGQEPNVLVPVNGDCYYNQPFSAGNEIGLLMKCSRYIANGKYDYQHWLTFFDPASATFSTPVLAADLGASDATVYAAGRSGEAMLAWGVVKVGVSLTCAQKVQRFSTAGKKLDLKPRQLQTTECSAGIATAGDQYVLATYNPNAPFQTTGHFLQSDGQEVPGIAVPLGRNHADFSIVADGQTVLAAQGAVLGDGSSRSDFNDEQLYISLFENSGELVKPAFPIAATPNLMSSPAVAWGGDSYLAIWSDTRNGPAPDVYGARISSTGAVLDNPPLPLIHDDAATVGTALASNGNGYLLVDKAQTNPTEIENRTMAVRVTPIDKNGKPGKQQKLFDGSGTPDGDIDARYNPRVIWDGKHYVLGWWGFGYYNDNKLNVMRLNADGTALDAGPVDLAVPGGMPVLATTPDGFLAVWVNQDGIYTAALADGPDKLEVSSDPTRISFYIGTTPSAACSPTVCAVVWAYGSGPSFDMELQLVDLKGHAIGQTRDFPLSLAEPLVTWNGLAFVVTSASGNNFVEYFGEDGAPVANTQMSLTPANTLWEVAAASDGAGHSLFVTGMFDDARLTGVMLGQQTEGDAGAGGAGGASDVGSGGTSVGGTNVGGASTAGTGGTGIASNGGSGGTEMVSAENGGEISTTGGAGIDNGAGTAGSPVQVEPTSDTQPQDGSGCGCRLTPTQSSSTPFALLAALALLAQRRRRGARLGHHPVG